MRVDAFRKGYSAGQPDMLILTLHKHINKKAVIKINIKWVHNQSKLIMYKD